jgi:hypothetical protein
MHLEREEPANNELQLTAGLVVDRWSRFAAPPDRCTEQSRRTAWSRWRGTMPSGRPWRPLQLNSVFCGRQKRGEAA